MPYLRSGSRPAATGGKVDVLPIAPLLAEAIRRLQNGAGLTTSSSFKGAIEPECIHCRDAKIVARKTWPLFRRSRVWFQQMGDRKPRAQRRAMAAIEQEQILGQTITQAAP